MWCFPFLVSIVIILCAIILGIETRLTDPFWMKLFVVVDILLTSFFILEITLRMLAEKSMLHFFHLVSVNRSDETTRRINLHYSEDGFWNWFDFIITVVSAVAIFTHFFQHPEYLLIARMFRIFRIFRLLEVSSQLKEIEKKIVNIIPTVFSFALLLFILIYIYSIVGFYLFEGRVMGIANFSNLYNSITTLFQVMTLDGWGEIMSDVNNMDLAISPLIISIYFISFVVLTAIVSLNVFIGVMAASIETKFSKNIEENKKRFAKLIKDETDQTDEGVEEGVNLILAEFVQLKNDMKKLNESIEEIRKQN
ncbi:MAG: hypothetical protein DRI71_03190 [Bacteroidetes bacterium]|nr:MAG: hypothetical protein DRI71_03190 [Bacteroidota bacterium]